MLYAKDIKEALTKEDKAEIVLVELGEEFTNEIREIGFK